MNPDHAFPIIVNEGIDGLRGEGRCDSGSCIREYFQTVPATAAVRRFVRAKKSNYPILFGTKRTEELFDPSETLPITVIIDKSGKVVGKIDGVIFPDEFEEKIRPLLG